MLDEIFANQVIWNVVQNNNEGRNNIPNFTEKTKKPISPYEKREPIHYAQTV